MCTLLSVLHIRRQILWILINTFERKEKNRNIFWIRVQKIQAFSHSATHALSFPIESFAVVSCHFTIEIFASLPFY